LRPAIPKPPKSEGQETHIQTNQGILPNITFDSSQPGNALEGVLTLPPGKTGWNLPLVVMPHGGPLNARDQIGFNWWAQAFASRGYAVFQPNYRGSDGHGSEFRRAAVGEYGRKMLTDMSDGVDALAAAGVIDKKRVCIVGAATEAMQPWRA
jgi:dipeptidyl aminopeptidase/acylaminoacyl peptidase